MSDSTDIAEATAPAGTPTEADETSGLALGTSTSPEPVFEADPAVPSTYTVKVGGETMEVSIEEALKGYQRQADYTRKTQELASEREQLSQAQQLWNAIEQNPEHTISAIADAYGFKLTAAEIKAAEAQQSAQEDDSTPADPRWQQVEQFMQQAQQEKLQAQIDRELATIHSKHGGVQFDDNRLLEFAVNRGIANLEDAFVVWTQNAAAKVAQDRQIQQKKSGIAVAGGHGTAAGVVNAGPGTKLLSIAEAIELAEQEASSNS